MFHDGRAYDDAVCRAGDHGGLIGCADAESDTNWHVSVGFDRGNEGGDVSRRRTVGTGDSGARKCVNEALGGLGKNFNALRWRGRGDDADVFQPGADGEILVLRGLIRR